MPAFPQGLDQSAPTPSVSENRDTKVCESNKSLSLIFVKQRLRQNTPSLVLGSGLLIGGKDWVFHSRGPTESYLRCRLTWAPARLFTIDSGKFVHERPAVFSTGCEIGISWSGSVHQIRYEISVSRKYLYNTGRLL